MPAVARKNGVDTVIVPMHGIPTTCPPAICCGFPSVITTAGGSNNVFVNLGSGGDGVVRSGDRHLLHPSLACVPHATPLETFAPFVFANGKHIGRLGDIYGLADPHVITTGSPNVFVGQGGGVAGGLPPGMAGGATAVAEAEEAAAGNVAEITILPPEIKYNTSPTLAGVKNAITVKVPWLTYYTTKYGYLDCILSEFPSEVYTPIKFFYRPTNYKTIIKNYPGQNLSNKYGQTVIPEHQQPLPITDIQFVYGGRIQNPKIPSGWRAKGYTGEWGKGGFWSNFIFDFDGFEPSTGEMKGMGTVTYQRNVNGFWPNPGPIIATGKLFITNSAGTTTKDVYFEVEYVATCQRGP